VLTGKKFRLNRATIAIETTGEDRQVVMVPIGAVVLVLSGPRPDDKRMIDVRWHDQTLVMFADDIQCRGEEVTEQTA
jgi:hypothetical protein